MASGRRRRETASIQPMHTTSRAFVRDRGGVRVVFGDGTLDSLADSLSAMKIDRAMLLATAGRRTEMDKVATVLGSRVAGILTSAEPHVPRSLVKRALAEMAEFHANAIVAVGGGSTIGLGKAIALEREISVIAVPTTYSGSEMTPVWGITEDGESPPRKVTGRDERVRPAMVVYDPLVTQTLPVGIAVTGIVNAMAHCVEALYAPALDPVTEAMAMQGLEVLAGALAEIDNVPDSGRARAEAFYGAHLAGDCLGSVRMGLHHKLCHVLGGRYRLPHAAMHTVLLPHVLRFNAEAVPDTTRRIARAMGAEDPVAALYDRTRFAGGPTDLASLGLESDQLEAVAEAALRNAYPNPREASVADIVGILQAALEGQRPTLAANSSAIAYGVQSGAYQAGFGGTFESEALPGAVPRRQNAPHRAPYGLYPEQVNGTAFVVDRAHNQRSWLYRVRPSLGHTEFVRRDPGLIVSEFHSSATPNLMRWKARALPDEPTDFVAGLATIAGAGDADGKQGLAIHVYVATRDMTESAFNNLDGDMVIIPETGPLTVKTELGVLHLRPTEIGVIPRGIKFSVRLPEGRARGWVLEVYDGHMELPNRGLIGANGLADERHFLVPNAAFEDRRFSDGFKIVQKYGGHMYEATQQHSCFDVVGWHGSYAPYKYDLLLFNAFGSVTWDHPDPSILTVLTCPVDDKGSSAADLVVFPPRWEAFDNSFRPPFYHRNPATEFNFVVRLENGVLGYEQGGYFYTPQNAAHGLGPRAVRRELSRSTEENNTPHRISEGQLWGQFESVYPLRVTEWAAKAPNLDPDFRALFDGLPSFFDRDDIDGSFD